MWKQLYCTSPFYKLIVSKSWYGARGLESLFELPGRSVVLISLLLLMWWLLLRVVITADDWFRASLPLWDSTECCFLPPKPNGNANSCGNFRIILPDVMRRPKPSCKSEKGCKGCDVWSDDNLLDEQMRILSAEIDVADEQMVSVKRHDSHGNSNDAFVASLVSVKTV